MWRHNSNVCNTLALSLSHIFFFQFAWYLSNSTFITIYCLRFKIITHTLRTCVELSHLVNFARRACDQCSVFSTICPDYGLLLELHTLTQVAISCALLIQYTCTVDQEIWNFFRQLLRRRKLNTQKFFYGHDYNTCMRRWLRASIGVTPSYSSCHFLLRSRYNCCCDCCYLLHLHMLVFVIVMYVLL